MDVSSEVYGILVKSTNKKTIELSDSFKPKNYREVENEV